MVHETRESQESCGFVRHWFLSVSFLRCSQICLIFTTALLYQYPGLPLPPESVSHSSAEPSYSSSRGLTLIGSFLLGCWNVRVSQSTVVCPPQLLPSQRLRTGQNQVWWCIPIVKDWEDGQFKAGLLHTHRRIFPSEIAGAVG